MDSPEYDAFSTEVKGAFKPTKSEARLLIGGILDSSGSPGKKILSDIYKFMGINVSVKPYDVTHFKKGEQAAKFYIAAHYWLHKSNKMKAIRNQVDNKVFGFEIDFDERYGKKNGDVASAVQVDLEKPAAHAAPYIWPKYILKKKAEEAEKELSKGGGESIWLNPYNHHSIPLIGREAEKKVLDKFIEPDDDFLTLYVVAPSGAGKTRLISQWMRKYVADPDDTEGFEKKFRVGMLGLLKTVTRFGGKIGNPNATPSSLLITPITMMR